MTTSSSAPKKARTDWLKVLKPLLGNRQVDLDVVLRAIVDEATRQLRADRGTFYLIDHATQELVSRAAHLPEIAEIRLRMGEGVAGWVAKHGEPLRVTETEDDSRHATHIDDETGYSTQNMCVVPVFDRRRVVIGVLQVLNRKSGDFSEADLHRLTEIAAEVAKVLDRTSLRSQLRPDHRQPLAFRFNYIVGDSARMQQVYSTVERAARTEATVVVRGETGTGKELIARAIHFNSRRRRGPFVKVDCAALPETLIENELFGHEKGAFTGADRATEGKVAAAVGGTLFLDEIGELSFSVQGKLLRLLQERVYHKVGGNEPKYAQVRFVGATHRNLEKAVEDGTFRQDLYYRLRVVEILVPPLRARGHGDIDRLVDHFLYEFTRTHGRHGLEIDDEARAALHSYPWPGNVRELEHCIESAVVLEPGPVITRESLSIRHGPLPEVGIADASSFITDPRPLREVERDYIRHVLAYCDGNRSAAARLLGIGRNTLARKLAES